MKIFLVLAFVLAAAGGSATAQTFEESRAAYDRGDYATALRGIQRLAKQGNAQAQFFLGGMYRCGEGIPQNAVQAARWYRRAAEQGNVAAQLNLGDMYRHGEPAWSNRHGICKDELPWFSRHSIRKNIAEAVKWYRRAAEQGNVAAQLNLGTAIPAKA